MRARALVVLVGLTTVMGMGCSKKDDSSAEPNNIQPTEASALYQKDLTDLANINSAGPTQYDSDHSGIFTQIFGGTDAASLQQYYQTRVKTVMLLTDNISTSPDLRTLNNQGWDTASPTSEDDSDDSKPQIGALNVGTLWWLEALVANVQLIITYQGNPIVVDSSRVGIVVLGEGYTDVLKLRNSDNKIVKVPVPPAYRESILMHEARHSDCTGGLSQEQLKAMETATDSASYEAAFPSRACGHLHILCPSSFGDLAGLAACDAEKWGAYAVGAIFSAATIDNYSGETDRELMDAIATDSASRFIGTDDGSAPDMSSAGVLTH